MAAIITALISTTVFVLTLLSIATLVYLRNRAPSRNSKSYTFYQYDPNPKYTPTNSTQPRISLLVVSPSCPVMVPLHSNKEMGVQMMQVMITPPTPVKKVVTTGNLV
jgi:hypothetical protein